MEQKSAFVSFNEVHLAYNLSTDEVRHLLGDIGKPILVASENQIVLAAMQSLLSSEEELDHHLTESYVDAINAIQSKQHGLLFCTQSLSSGNGTGLVKDACSLQSDLPIIFLLTKKTELSIITQIDFFCSAIIAEWDLGDPEEPFLLAIRAAVEASSSYRSPSILAYLQRYEEYADGVLTPREKTVLDLILTGMSNKEIASQLFLSSSTAKSYSRDVMRKLGVKNRQQAILLAIEHGLLGAQP